jgi:hypothetical protein
MWGMEDHGGLDLTETETETDLTPAGYKATMGYPSHNANHRTTGSIMPPCLDPVQGRCPQSPDSPGATGILYGRLLEGGFLFGVALVLRRRRKQVDIGFVSPRALLGDHAFFETRRVENRFMTGPTGISQPSQPSEYRPPRHIRALLDRAPKTPHHLVDPDAQQEAALRLAMEGAKPANAAVSLSNFSLHAPKQPTAQTRNADIPVPSGNLKRGFASDERRGI